MYCTWYTTQQGSALVISLVFLIILAMLGIASIQTTTLEERMAGNLRDRDMAFQAAEAALRQGEEDALTLTPSDFPDPAKGLYEAGTNNLFATVDWNATDSLAYPGVQKVAQNPRYIIEQMGFVSAPSGSLAADEPVDEKYMYRITAKGVGGTDSAVVILQSTYSQ